MAAVACNKSDTVILTSDNPRTEEPYSILKEMEKKYQEINGKKFPFDDKQTLINKLR